MFDAAYAQALPGVAGSRLTGGGFGGSIITLVESGRASEVAELIARKYREQTGIDASTFICRIADGAAARWKR